MALKNITIDMIRNGATLAGAVATAAAGGNKHLAKKEIDAFVGAHASPNELLGAEEVGLLLDEVYKRARKASQSGYAPSLTQVNKTLARAVAEAATKDKNRNGRLSPAEQKSLSPLATMLMYFSHQFRGYSPSDLDL